MQDPASSWTAALDGPNASALQALLANVHVASLAVLENNVPATSLVPFALAHEPTRFVVLISELSSHTSALRAHSECSLLVHEPAITPSRVHSLVRLSVRAVANFVSREVAAKTNLQALYLERFPSAQRMLGLGDFHFVTLTPTAATFIQGFGRAYKVSGVALNEFEHVRPNREKGV